MIVCFQLYFPSCHDQSGRDTFHVRKILSNKSFRAVSSNCTLSKVEFYSSCSYFNALKFISRYNSWHKGCNIIFPIKLKSTHIDKCLHVKLSGFVQFIILYTPFTGKVFVRVQNSIIYSIAQRQLYKQTVLKKCVVIAHLYLLNLLTEPSLYV